MSNEQQQNLVPPPVQPDPAQYGVPQQVPQMVPQQVPQMVPQQVPQQVPQMVPQQVPQQVPSGYAPPAQMMPQVAPQSDQAQYQQMGMMPGMMGPGGFNPLAIDLTNVKDSYILIEDGAQLEYIIKEAEIDTARSSGNNQLKLELEVVFPAQWAGVTVLEQCTFTEKSMWKFKSLCSACDVWDQANRRYTIDNVKQLIGRRVRGTNGHRVDQTDPNKRYNCVAGGFSRASAPQQ